MKILHKREDTFNKRDDTFNKCENTCNKREDIFFINVKISPLTNV